MKAPIGYWLWLEGDRHQIIAGPSGWLALEFFIGFSQYTFNFRIGVPFLRLHVWFLWRKGAA